MQEAVLVGFVQTNQDRRSLFRHAGLAALAVATGMASPGLAAGRTVNWDPGESADAAPSLQAAIDQLRASGGTVLLPEGSFRLRRTVQLPSRVKLQGSGTLATRLDCSGLPPGAPAFAFVRGDALVCEFAHLADFTMLGQRGKRGAALYVPPGTGCRNCRHERLRIESFYRGYHVEGELYASRIEDVEANYLVCAFEKSGPGYMTSLEISWFKCHQCFHGFLVNRSTYSRFSYYYDHCGLSATWPEAPPNEVPVSFQALDECVNLDLFTGHEYSPAMVLRAGAGSTVSMAAALVFSPTGLWSRRTNRSANAAFAEQGVFASHDALIELRNLRLILHAPQAATGRAPLLAGSGPRARFTLSNCLIDVDCYTLSNLETPEDPSGSRRIALGAGSEVNCVSMLTGRKRRYGT